MAAAEVEAVVRSVPMTTKDIDLRATCLWDRRAEVAARLEEEEHHLPGPRSEEEEEVVVV